jgi:hypothetical protein
MTPNSTSAGLCNKPTVFRVESSPVSLQESFLPAPGLSSGAGSVTIYRDFSRSFPVTLPLFLRTAINFTVKVYTKGPRTPLETPQQTPPYRFCDAIADTAWRAQHIIAQRPSAHSAEHKGLTTGMQH